MKALHYLCANYQIAHCLQYAIDHTIIQVYGQDAVTVSGPEEGKGGVSHPASLQCQRGCYLVPFSGSMTHLPVMLLSSTWTNLPTTSQASIISPSGLMTAKGRPGQCDTSQPKGGRIGFSLHLGAETTLLHDSGAGPGVTSHRSPFTLSLGMLEEIGPAPRRGPLLIR